MANNIAEKILENFKFGGKLMEEGTRTNIDDFLTVRGFGGYGYGGGYGGGGGSLYTGNNVLAAKAHAEGTGIGENIKSNRFLMDRGMESIRDSFENAQRDRQFSNLSKEHTDLERRVNDQNAAMVATLNDVRSESAACCCETQKLILAENGKTREEFQKSLLESANARVTQLETIAAIKESGGHGRG